MNINIDSHDGKEKGEAVEHLIVSNLLLHPWKRKNQYLSLQLTQFANRPALNREVIMPPIFIISSPTNQVWRSFIHTNRITKATKQGKEISLGILQKRKQKRERWKKKMKKG